MLFTERKLWGAVFAAGAAVAIELLSGQSHLAAASSPLPWGEVAERSEAGEGLQSLDNPKPPHPNPLPSGERESRPACGHTAIKPRRSALLGAVARGDLLLGRVLGRLLLDHRVEDRKIGLVVAGDHLPLLAVPLLDARNVGALVVLTAQLDRADHALEAELLDARGGQIEILEAPANLLAGHRLVAVLLHGGADRLGAKHGVEEAAVVEHLRIVVLGDR